LHLLSPSQSTTLFPYTTLFRSGAGKTTLVNLLPRFADPSGGRVLIDGQEIRQVRLADLRSQISLVLQESFLLPLSVAENIALAQDRNSTRLNSSHEWISYAVFC